MRVEGDIGLSVAVGGDVAVSLEAGGDAELAAQVQPARIAAELSVAERDIRLDLTAGGAPRVEGASSYADLADKPSIEGVALVGDRRLAEFGVRKATNMDILALFR